MAPLGFMSKCGGRNQNLISAPCDCTHYCASSLTFVPWFTGLHEALPELLRTTGEGSTN